MGRVDDVDIVSGGLRDVAIDNVGNVGGGLDCSTSRGGEPSSSMEQWKV